MRAVWGLTVLLAVLPLAARADDGAASLGAGSIVFTHGTPIRMTSEDLYISPKQVRIRFAFTNDTDHDVETVVAFPLPDIDVGNYWTEALGAITEDPVNFVGFTAKADGKPIAFATEQRAISLTTHKDVTALIQDAGLPVNMLTRSRTDAFYRMLKAIPPNKLKALIAAGALDPGWQGLPGYPYWIMRTRFYWTQRFPAHKTVVIAHSYQPISGTYNSASYFMEGDMGARYCTDFSSKAALALLLARHEVAGTESGALFTDYILKTAATWNGPIGRFHLTLDKLSPQNVLSICWPEGLHQTGPTTFEFTAAHFTPSRDIAMVVLQ